MFFKRVILWYSMVWYGMESMVCYEISMVCYEISMLCYAMVNVVKEHSATVINVYARTVAVMRLHL